MYGKSNELPEAAASGRMANHVSDATLLERFVTCREEAAFAALVQRHGPRVLGACRQILRNEHDAEDAFQATFLLLARKAADMPWRESVGGWLYAAAHRLSLNARAGVLRRHRREIPLGEDMQADPVKEIAQRELRWVLDDELDRLPEKYRAPVVLCYLEGMTNEEAARTLGWPAGSMSRRLERARGLLRRRLAGRGLSLILVAILAGVATIGSWPRVPPASRGALAVREAMTPFKPRTEGGMELGNVLTLIGQPDHTPPERHQVLVLARQARSTADRIEQHDPGRNRPEWRKSAGEMRLSALLLAQATDANDEPALRAAARRLSTSCTQCHLAFRQ
jgi:RNA polymerase sigma-70 factor (ECF subfamily)